MQVAVLMIEGAFDSGLTTVIDVLRAANVLREEVENPPPPWEVTIIGPRRHLHTASGLRVTATPPSALPAPPDVLVVPALGLKSPSDLVGIVTSPSMRRTVGLISAAHHGGTALAAACSGTLFLAESGALDGRDATTSWWLGPMFRQRYPGVRLDPSATLVIGDGVRTAGAAFAHIDLALSLVHQRSPALAELVARYLLIGDRASQAVFAVSTILARHSPDMSAFDRWVRAHLHTPIRVGDAAAAIGVSERTLQRITATAMDMTPVEFVNEVRVEEASHLLRSTSLTIDVVASRVGFANPGTLRALMRRRRGVTLGELRRPIPPGAR